MAIGAFRPALDRIGNRQVRAVSASRSAKRNPQCLSSCCMVLCEVLDDLDRTVPHVSDRHGGRRRLRGQETPHIVKLGSETHAC